MPGLVSVYRRFIASTRGVAAIEFAMILPVILILLLATFDGGRAIAIYMKVRSATYILGAITNQYSTTTPIQASDMQAITGATSAVLAPYSSSPIVVTISQISINSNAATAGTVNWSYSLNGTALAQNSSATIPAGFLPLNTKSPCGSTYPCYLLLASVSYSYTPSFGYFAKGGITLSDSVYVTPRSSNCVAYFPQTGSSCT
jgi:Flp pilus assembly protein TadG